MEVDRHSPRAVAESGRGFADLLVDAGSFHRWLPCMHWNRHMPPRDVAVLLVVCRLRGINFPLAVGCGGASRRGRCTRTVSIVLMQSRILPTLWRSSMCAVAIPQLDQWSPIPRTALTCSRQPVPPARNRQPKRCLDRSRVCCESR